MGVAHGTSGLETTLAPLKLIVVPVLLLSGSCETAATAQTGPPSRDSPPPEVRFVEVDHGVELEVLDWGGRGRPIVLLAGLGNTAHVFDDFARHLSEFGHVLGVTRRGYGASSRPESGYDTRRLGEDIVAVLGALNLESPILAGHSLAGQEISHVASRHPEKIAGAVYLDAAYRYAWYTPTPQENLRDLQDRLGRLDPVLSGPPLQPSDLAAQIETIMGDALSEFQRDLDVFLMAPDGMPGAPRPGPADLVSVEAYRAWSLRTLGYSFPRAEIRATRDIETDGAVGARSSPPEIGRAIMASSERFESIDVPALAIYASPHTLGPWAAEFSVDPAVLDAFRRFDRATTERQASAFERGVPGSRVILLPDAHHYLFLTHETEVLAALGDFIARLPE